ncbi:MAG: ACP S-malonyltransferase, partial [Chloroflexi bacterium]|nr:ACP S-malonyltransferase [Chloroflexota bacterium]
RGRLMKEAGSKFPGGMAAILGLDNAVLEQVCREASRTGVVCIANYNSPGQTVISGENTALGEAMQLALEAGAKRAIRLAVSIASHSPLMSQAARLFGGAIERCKIGDAEVPLLANVSAEPVSAAAAIKMELAEQLCGAVRWQQSIERMVENGTTRFVEVGPGQVLAGLIRRIDRRVQIAGVGDIHGLESCKAIWR